MYDIAHAMLHIRSNYQNVKIVKNAYIYLFYSYLQFLAHFVIIWSQMQISKNNRVMKTITQTTKQNKKIVALSIMLIAISTISFSQIRNVKDFLFNNVKEKFFQTEEKNSSFMTVSYYEAAEWNESPAISKTIFVSSADISYEENMEVEEWMTSTFEYKVENSVEIEAWMTAPFDALIEEDIKVENWMSSPFESSLEDDIEIENWMTNPMAWNN